MFFGFLLFKPVSTDLGIHFYCLGYILVLLHVSGKGKGLELWITGKELCSWVVANLLL